MIKVSLQSTFLFLFIAISPILMAQDLQLGLLVNYGFETNYQDSSPNAFNATNFGAVFAQDRFGNANAAIYLNGDEYVEFPNVNDLKPDFPFSTSTWILLEDLNDDSPVYDLCFEEDNYFGAWMNIFPPTDPRIGIAYGDGGGSTGPDSRQSVRALNNIELGNWLHVVAIYNSPTDLKIYYNGCLQVSPSSGTGELEIVYSDSPGNLGRHDSDVNAPPGYFKGWIDEFYMWNRSISEEEIDLLYNDFYADTNSNITYDGCSGDGYEVMVNGAVYNESNPTGQETITTTFGCNDIVSINLSFENSFTDELEASFCEGEDVVVNGITYSEAGVYTQQLGVTLNGCDSIALVTISEFSNEKETQNYTLSTGQVITVNGVNYSQAGMYTQNLMTNNGCSLILSIIITNAFECDQSCNVISSISDEQIIFSAAGEDEFNLQINGATEISTYKITKKELILLMVHLEAESTLGVSDNFFESLHSKKSTLFEASKLAAMKSSRSQQVDFYFKGYNVNHSDAEINHLIRRLESKYTNIVSKIEKGGKYNVTLSRSKLQN